MPERHNALEQKLIEWLGSEGYRLEYQTMKAFRQLGLTALLGTHIKSADGKPRELDVSVWMAESPPNKFLAVRWICECKYTAGQPWVLLDSDLEMSVEDLWNVTPKSNRLHGTGIPGGETQLSGTWHFAKSQRFAHSIVQAKFKPDGKMLHGQRDRDNRDFAFGALQKIANAAWDLLRIGDDQDIIDLEVVIPCIVIDGPLFLAQFDHDQNDFTISKVSVGRLCWWGCGDGTMVDVVQMSGITEYAQNVRGTFDKVMDLMRKSDRAFQ